MGVEAVAIAPSDPLTSSNILTNTSVREGLMATIALTIDNIDVILIGYNLIGAYYLNKVIGVSVYHVAVINVFYEYTVSVIVKWVTRFNRRNYCFRQ